MESNTNNISSAGLHGLDRRQRRSETSEEIDVRQGQNALGSLSLSTGLTPREHDCRFVARVFYFNRCRKVVVYNHGSMKNKKRNKRLNKLGHCLSE